MSHEQRATLQKIVQRPQRHFTLGEVAKRLNVRRRTVLGWVNSGRLGGLRLSPRIIRILESDLIAFIDAARDAAGGDPSARRRSRGQGVSDV